MNSDLKDRANFYANLAKFDRSQTAKDIASTAIKDGIRIVTEDDSKTVPLAGVAFIRDHVLNQFPSRLRNSLDSLERVRRHVGNILPESLQFQHLPEQLIARDFSGARTSRREQFVDDQRRAYNSLTRERVSERDVLSQNFGWVNDIEFTLVEQKERDYQVHPFNTLHPSVRIIFDTFGVAFHNRRRVQTGVKITEMLRSMDRHFPRHYDPDSVLRLIMSPEIINNQSALADVLCAMGLRETICEEASIRIIRARETLMLSGVVGGFSFGDPLLSSLPPSESMSLCDGVESLTPNVRLNNMIKSIGNLYALHRMVSDGVVYRLELMPKDLIDASKVLRTFGMLRTIFDRDYKFDPEFYGLRSA
jgi:hypothetical protein